MGCHLVYYYALYWLSTLTGLITGLFTIDLLNQSILQAEPLTPFLADFIGREDLGSGATEALTLAERRELQWIYMVFVFAIGTLTAPLAFGLPYYNVWILQRINQDLRLALVERWHQLSLRYHGDHRVGDSVYRIYQDSAQVTAIVGMLVSVATQATTYGTTIVFIAALDPLLGLMGATIAVIAVLWGRWFSRRVRSRSLTARETNSDLTSRTQEVLGAMRVIKACSAEDAEQRRFEADSVIAFNAAYRIRSLVAGVSIIMFTFAGTILLAGEFFMAVWAAENREAFAAVLIGLVGLSFVRWNLGAFQWARDELIKGSNVVGGGSEAVDQRPGHGHGTRPGVRDTRHRTRRRERPGCGADAECRQRDSVRWGGVRLPGRPAGAARREFHGPRRRNHRHRRSDGVGEEYADGASDSAVRPRRRQHRGRRGQPAEHRRGEPAPQRRHRSSGKRAVRPECARQPPLCSPRRHRRSDTTGRVRVLRRRLRGKSAGGTRYRARRPGREALHRPASATIHRPGHREGRTDPDS